MTMLKSHIDFERQNLIAGASAMVAAAFMMPVRSFAQTYHERHITFTCTWPGGGTADQSMRALCLTASRMLGQNIAVKNKVGASGMIGTKAMAAAKPDGYTIGQIPISVKCFSQLGTLQLDPLKDFTYLVRTSGQTFLASLHQQAQSLNPCKNWSLLRNRIPVRCLMRMRVWVAQHMLAWKNSPSRWHSIQQCDLKGGAEALQDVLGGHIDLLADSSSWAPHVEAGKLKLLAAWG